MDVPLNSRFESNKEEEYFDEMCALQRAALVNAKGGGGATALHIVAGRDPSDETTLHLLLKAGAPTDGWMDS